MSLQPTTIAARSLCLGGRSTSRLVLITCTPINFANHLLGWPAVSAVGSAPICSRHTAAPASDSVRVLVRPETQRAGQTAVTLAPAATSPAVLPSSSPARAATRRESLAD